MRAIVTLPHCNNCIAHCTECGNLGDGTWPETLYVPLVRVWQSPIAMAEVISLGEGGIRLSKRLKKKVVEIMRNVVVGWWRAAGWPGKDESSHSDSDNCLWGRSRFAAAAATQNKEQGKTKKAASIIQSKNWNHSNVLFPVYSSSSSVFHILYRQIWKGLEKKHFCSSSPKEHPLNMSSIGMHKSKSKQLDDVYR